MTEQPHHPGQPTSNQTVGALIGEFIVEKQREKEEEARRIAKSRPRSLAIAVLLVLCVAVAGLTLFLERPEPPPSADRIEAGARVRLFLASERVRDFQRRTGALPPNLVEASIDSAGLTYWRSTDSVFEIWTEVAGRRLHYRSTMPSADFLGSAMRLLGTTR